MDDEDMSALLDDIKLYIETAVDSNGVKIFDGYKFQFELWNENEFEARDRFVTIRSIGGLTARPWNRFPAYEVFITGRQAEGSLYIGNAAEALAEYIRENYKSDLHSNITTVEPKFAGLSEMNRSIYMMTLTNQTKC